MVLSRLSLALLLAGRVLLAAEPCARCHRAEYDKQTLSRHAHALRPIGQSPLFALFDRPANPEGVDPVISYRASASQVLVTARRDTETLSGTIAWAFGAGAQGITPVGMIGPRYFEHRYSFFPRADRFALTFGHPVKVSTVGGDMGVLQDSRTIAHCFSCHATNVQAAATGPDLSNMIPGVTCERCHGPGRAHVEAVMSGDIQAVRKTLPLAVRLAPKAEVRVCGECHRLPAPGSSSPEPEIEDPVSVRFAPIGLMASRCFAESGKLACGTCHDPHADARPRSDRFYTGRCLTCHGKAPAKTSACRRARGEDCLSCHMRQVPLTAYLKFTDHRIRIYR